MGALKANIQTLKQLDIQNFKILITIVPPRPSTVGQEAKNFLESSGMPVLNNMVNRFAVYPKAALEGLIVVDVKSDRYSSIAWSDYKAVGKEING
jgi:chromosome partitioning protein